MVRFIHPKRGSPKKTSAEDSIIGEIFSATVSALGGQGQALITHPSGQKIFVHGAWLNEEITVKVFAQKNNIGFAHLLAVLQPHPHRIQSPCPHHGTKPNTCGGCPWLFIEYSEQLQAKQQRIEAAMAKLYRTNTCSPVKPIARSSSELHYRTRAQFKTNGTELGFIQTGSHRLVDIDKCIVLSDTNQQHLANIRSELPNAAWQPKKLNHWTTLDIDDQAQAVSVNRRLPFRQANATQNRFMRDWLSHQLALLPKDKTVLELFCGSGNFTEIIASQGFKACTALEGASDATNTLKQKHLANIHVETCDLFSQDQCNKLIEKHKSTHILILDPPRDGFKLLPQVLAGLKKVEHIYYISCDLATLCRDITPLLAKQFDLAQVQPVDVFPQTAHVEVLTHLTRKKAQKKSDRAGVN